MKERLPAFNALDVMPFGKYKGKLLRDIPANYLERLWQDLCDLGYDKSFVTERLTDSYFQDRIKVANYIWNAKPILKANTQTMKERDPEDIADDLKRLDYGDKQILTALDKLYHLYREKGLIYRELCASVLTGNIKYIVTAKPKNQETEILVTDLDTNIVYVL